MCVCVCVYVFDRLTDFARACARVCVCVHFPSLPHEHEVTQAQYFSKA